MKKQPYILGISGHAQAGKDTIADYLVKNYGYTKMSFAKYLKEMVNDLFDLNDNIYKKDYLKKWGMTKRELLQIVGTKMREIHLNVWVYKLFGIIGQELLFGSKRFFVISDVRYPNEIAAIKEKDGSLIRVIRTGYKSPLSLEEQSHPSETALDNISDSEFDLVIKAKSNNIKKIYKEIDNFMEKICTE